ncbi:MAG: hypothetical protein F6K28_44560 [Microcoleus sp. SIO2G3]|nr:hypothetical protein [Microcoleus sp. SIO2G3]
MIVLVLLNLPQKQTLRAKFANLASEPLIFSSTNASHTLLLSSIRWVNGGDRCNSLIRDRV